MNHSSIARLTLFGLFISIFVNTNSPVAQAAECTSSNSTSGGYTYVLITAVGNCEFTKPLGVSAMNFETWGAGGGSMGQDNQNGASSGGAYAKSINVNVSAVSLIYVRVGAGGTGGQASGTAGGDSWVNTSNTLPTSSVTGALAKGGSGAPVATPNNSTQLAGSIGTTIYIGGKGGVAAEGGGGAGASSFGNGGDGASVNGGAGGSSPSAGAGGAAGNTSNNGGDGISNVEGGGGGGGSYNQRGGNGGAPGGAGGAGWSTTTIAPTSGVNTNAIGYGGSGGRGQVRLSYQLTAVSSFSSNQATPTNTNSAIAYSLTMSESVTGMDNSDFENAGTATSCIFAVSGSGSSYTLSISSCSEGTLIPRLKANSVTGSTVGPVSATAATATITIDRTVPSINSVTPPSNGTYKPSDTPTFTVAFSETVTITGTPRLTLTVGTNSEYANYVSQTDSRTALFRYTVANDVTEFDVDGISVLTTLDLNGGTITDLASNALSPLTFTAPNTASILVAQPPAAPIIDSATAGSGFISIYFRAGTTYGSAITNYQYSTNNGGAWTTRSPVDTSTPLTIFSLTNGTSYQVRIRAVSAVGTSDSSTSITATPNAVTVAGGSNLSTTYGGTASSAAFTSSGGVAPYVYTLSTSISGITILNGVVTVSSSINAGTYSMNIISTDAYLANGTKAITITVAKAVQDTLTITSTAGVFNGNPSTLSLLTSGGSDTGTVTYSIASGGTATGCSISGSQLSVNTSGTCRVVATKATTTNYLIAYSDTSTITFVQYVSRQPVQTQSVPVQIPISGQNSLDLSQTITVPAVTGVFLVGSTYEINGTGFTGVTRVVIGGFEANISSSSATKIVIDGVGLMPGPLFIECSDGRIGPSPFYFFVP